MHTLFEGVSPLLLNQLFGYLISNHFVTLDEINSEIKRVCSDYSEVDTLPSRVFFDNGRFHFKQKGYINFFLCLNFNYLFVYIFTAAQMKTLVRYLPFAIGRKIPDQDAHWTCFLTYWEICNIALAYEVKKEDSTHLGWLIQVFLEMFKSLYGDTVNLTPKMHQLIHFSEQMLR